MEQYFNLYLISVTRFGDLLDFGQLFNLPQSPPLLGNFWKGVKIFIFSNVTIFGQLLETFGDFYLVTLYLMGIESWGGFKKFVSLTNGAL